MEEKNEWVFYQQIDWECPKNNRFNVDTRDFHCGYYWKDEEHPDTNTLIKYPHFFFTKEELITLLDRYYNESGGEEKWRYFSLENYQEGWDLKYIRIFRTDKGFIVCNSDSKALKKEILNNNVCQKTLHG